MRIETNDGCQVKLVRTNANKTTVVTTLDGETFITSGFYTEETIAQMYGPFVQARPGYLKIDIPDIEAMFPCVITGSGGRHYYAKKPADVSVVDTLQDFPGVEFKSKGRQVVAAGSIHPETEALYRWDQNAPKPEEMPELPHALLCHIRRPQRSAATSGGQYDQEQCEAILARMDPIKYRDQDRWRSLMMAFHHASNGDARQEFIDWSISDPKYHDQADVIGRRWDSCHTDRGGEAVVTIGTLRHYLAEDGISDALPPGQGQAAADFADARDLDETDFVFEPDDTPELDDGVPSESQYSDESESALGKLNNKFCAVFNRGRYRIYLREAYAGNLRWAAASKADFLNRYENQFVENGKQGRGVPRTIALGNAWQEWPNRKTADGTTFDTRAEPAEIVNGALNLWLGFAIQPKQGACELFVNMIRDDLCDGDTEVFEYVLNWTAWKLQNPGSLPQTALAFVGKKGTGKTTFGQTLAEIFGGHGMVADNIDQIAGRFNGHLETKCFVYADEAVWGGGKRNESALKKLITDREGVYEYKGVDIFSGPNHVGLVLAGNDKWIVPASIDERRFCVSQVSEKHRAPDDDTSDNHPNRLYWKRIYQELDGGGRAAFLHKMLQRDLGDWHPRTGVPRTKAMGEQKFQGLTGVARWWYEVLRDGELPDVCMDSEEADWSEQPLRVSGSKVTKAYSDWLHFENPHTNVSSNSLLRELKDDWGWKGGDDQFREAGGNRDRYWLMPRLDHARKLFAERLGTNPFE